MASASRHRPDDAPASAAARDVRCTTGQDELAGGRRRAASGRRGRFPGCPEGAPGHPRRRPGRIRRRPPCRRPAHHLGRFAAKPQQSVAMLARATATCDSWVSPRAGLCHVLESCQTDGAVSYRQWPDLLLAPVDIDQYVLFRAGQVRTAANQAHHTPDIGQTERVRVVSGQRAQIDHPTSRSRPACSDSHGGNTRSTRNSNHDGAG